MIRHCLILLTALVIATAPVAAEERDEWQPDPPPQMPENWDWVQTTSDEWLKGEILDMYKEKLTFDSSPASISSSPRSWISKSPGFGTASKILGRTSTAAFPTRTITACRSCWDWIFEL